MLIFRSSLLLPFLAVVSLEHQASGEAGQEWKFPSDYPASHHATALISVDPRNVVTTTELDDWERPTHVTVTGGETPLEEWFEYDAVGRLRSHKRRRFSWVLGVAASAGLICLPSVTHAYPRSGSPVVSSGYANHDGAGQRRASRGRCGVSC